ncbi:MAG: DUF3459 domain-containing protein [Chromatiales bacterium]|nr:DUF3459 domain-containing protein [Chromatiales bacterium]
MNRFLWVSGGDKQQATAWLPCASSRWQGAPVIYYGTEVGLSQPADVMQHGRAIHEETRMPMLWGDDQDRDLFEFYRELIKIRKTESALAHGTRENIYATEEILVYRRVDGNGSLLCAMNISEKAMEFELDVAESSPMLMTRFECRIQAEGGKKRLFLPPFSGMIVK